MSLNYFRPHKNVVVLCVAQVSFLLTSFKYILAIVLDDVAEEEREMLRWVLIVLDVCFVLGSIGSVFAVFYLLSSHVKEDIEEEKSSEKVKVMGSTTKVVPRNVNKKLRVDEIRKWERSEIVEGEGGDGDGDEENGLEQTNNTHASQQQRRLARRSTHQRSISEQEML
jgi:hypothetical protein